SGGSEREVVPGVGVEPTNPCGWGILSPLRIPVSPSGQHATVRLGASRQSQPVATGKSAIPGRVACDPDWRGGPVGGCRTGPRRIHALELEAWVGIEPAYAALQAAA